MRDLRRSPFYRVLHRPNLFLGGERNLVMFTLLVCAGIAVASLNVWTAVIGTVIWFSCIGLFRQMAKHDPYLSRVYIRHKKYQTYYAPNSRVARTDWLLRESKK